MEAQLSQKPKSKPSQKPALKAHKQSYMHMTHIRRCHICGGINESPETVVTKCDHCGKTMAPFYFFNEAETAPISDCELRPVLIPGDRSPVRGLTAIW